MHVTIKAQQMEPLKTINAELPWVGFEPVISSLYITHTCTRLVLINHYAAMTAHASLQIVLKRRLCVTRSSTLVSWRTWGSEEQASATVGAWTSSCRGTRVYMYTYLVVHVQWTNFMQVYTCTLLNIVHVHDCTQSFYCPVNKLSTSYRYKSLCPATWPNWDGGKCSMYMYIWYGVSRTQCCS